MVIFETSLVLGVTLGLVYALAGVSLVVIYRTSGYASFCHGDIAAVSLYVGYLCHEAGLPYLVMALVVVATGAVLGLVIGAGVIVPLERFGHLSAALATVGVGLLIQGIENVTLSDLQPRPFPAAGGSGTAFTLGPVELHKSDVIAAVVCAALFIALGLFFKLSRVGVAMRAVNDNASAANHVGLSGRSLKYLSWGLSGALASVCGLFVAPIYSLTPYSVNALLVFGFATIVLGGFESVLGALVAGVVIGVASNMFAAYLDTNLVTFGVYVLLLVVLLFKPSGLFGRRALVRV
jgi:branched-chain amino acid transport system permease protein